MYLNQLSVLNTFCCIFIRFLYTPISYSTIFFFSSLYIKSVDFCVLMEFAVLIVDTILVIIS